MGGYKEKDLKKFSSLVNLKYLKMNMGSVESLEGLEGLQLEKVVFRGGYKLKDIRVMNGWQRLKSVEFETCGAVFDFSALKGLLELQSLEITSCKAIKSISFVDELPALTQLALLGNTDVSDSDLRPAARIKELYYKPQKHYNIKITTPRADAVRKTNREVILKAADKLNGKK